MHFRAFSLLVVVAVLALGLSRSVAAEAINCEPDPGTNMDIDYSDTVLCELDTNDDTDVFHFVANAGDRPFIKVIRDPGAGVSDYVRVILYAPNGDLLFNTNYNRSPSIVSVVLGEDGVHTIVVEAQLNTTGDDGLGYTLELPCVAGKCANQPLPATLGYTAVQPCRIVDTRFGVGGSLSVGETRQFHSYGDISEQNQAAGGAPADYPAVCPFALGEHTAVHLNVTAVPLGPSGQKGFATLWPWNTARPAASFINYAAGSQNIANAGIVKTTASAGSDPDFSVYASRNIDLVIDVLGYFTE
jgi:hypothetical protein